MGNRAAAPVANNVNVVQIKNNLNIAGTQKFAYDQLNRVASGKTQAATGPHCWGETFAYDIWGNLLSIGALPGYTGCNQENLSVGATPSNQISGYGYDAAGNLTNVPALASHSYDAENRLTVTAGVTYTYDGDGKRAKKSNGKLYWYGTGSEALLETDLTGNNATQFVFFNGQRIARRKLPSGEINYYFSDHLGSSRVVTTATGQILDDSDFYPFGGERPAVSSSGSRYKFTGKERDSESGLDNFGARYNSSGLGRFMSPDDFWKDSHVGDPQSWNKYAYARNNPLRYVDPTGEKATVTTNCTTNDQNQTTCNVKIQASIAIYAAEGSNLTQEQLQAAASTIQSSIQDAWNGTFVQDGVTYNVTTQVSVEVAASQGAAMETGAQNVIAMTNGPMTINGRILGG